MTPTRELIEADRRLREVKRMATHASDNILHELNRDPNWSPQRADYQTLMYLLQNIASATGPDRALSPPTPAETVTVALPGAGEETCPVCEGKLLAPGSGCMAGCRDGIVLTTSANVLRNMMFWFRVQERELAGLRMTHERREAIRQAARVAVGDNTTLHPWHVIDETICAMSSPGSSVTPEKPGATVAAANDEGVAFVAGPIWQEAEEEQECWTAEIQTVGGHNVIATVHGASRDEASQRQSAVMRALATSRSQHEGASS